MTHSSFQAALHHTNGSEAMLYVHIPFCEQKCIYCDFYSIAHKKHLAEYFQALLQELTLRRHIFPYTSLSSVYIGGGTPSILPIDWLQTLFRHIEHSFLLTESPEITLEANPEHLTAEYLKALKQQTPINRLSIGIQAFQDDILASLNRRHSGEQAVNSIKEAQDKGFNNLSIDLMYALPGLSDEQWEENLQKAFTIHAPHLSAYCLSVSEKTMLHTLIKKNKITLPSEETAVQHFNMLCQYADKYGFEHYEISNFALPDYQAKHNSGYWTFKPYMGIGASAHSFNAPRRQWNVSSVKEYIKRIQQNSLPHEEEILTETEHFNEQVFLGLRLKNGIALTDISEKFRCSLIDKSQPFLQQGLLDCSNAYLRLTRKGIMLSDYIAAELFIAPSDSSQT